MTNGHTTAAARRHHPPAERRRTSPMGSCRPSKHAAARCCRCQASRMPVGHVRRVVTVALPRITAEELRERQERLRGHAPVSVAWRECWCGPAGSSTQDQYADVYYLSNFYSHYPAVPDADGRWRAKGFSGLVVPADGPVTLVTDLASFRDDLTYVDRVLTDQDVVGAAIRTAPRGRRQVRRTDRHLGERGACRGGGTATMVETIGDRFVSADDLGPELRLSKCAAEQSLLRAAGQVGVLGVEAILDAAGPGATAAEVAAAGFAAVLNAGGMVYGISLSTGPYAHFYSQSQPAPFDSRYELQEGDMARVDFYGSVDGYLFDFGRSRVVGHEPDESPAAAAGCEPGQRPSRSRRRTTRRDIGRRRPRSRPRVRGLRVHPQRNRTRARVQLLGPQPGPQLGGALHRRRFDRGDRAGDVPGGREAGGPFRASAAPPTRTTCSSPRTVTRTSRPPAPITDHPDIALTSLIDLFDEVTVGPVRFRNRIAMAPMGQHVSGVDGRATPWHLVHYGSRAVGGCGLLVVEDTAVSAAGRVSEGGLGAARRRPGGTGSARSPSSVGSTGRGSGFSSRTPVRRRSGAPAGMGGSSCRPVPSHTRTAGAAPRELGREQDLEPRPRRRSSRPRSSGPSRPAST